MSLKRILNKIGLVKSRSTNRNRHDHQLFTEIWRKSETVDQVIAEYGKFTPVTRNQAVQLFYLLEHRYKLPSLDLKRRPYPPSKKRNEF